MSFPTEINILDLILVIIMVLFALRGLCKGFLAEMAGLVGLVGGVFVAGHYYGQLGRQFSLFIKDPSWANILAYVLILCGVLAVVAVVTRLLHKLLAAAYAGWIDHLAGGVAGFLKGFVICALMVALLRYFFTDAGFMQTSRLIEPISRLSEVLKGYLPGTF